MKYVIRRAGGPVRKVPDDHEIPSYLDDPPANEFRPSSRARFRFAVREVWRYATPDEMTAAGFASAPKVAPKPAPKPAAKPVTKPATKTTKKRATSRRKT